MTRRKQIEYTQDAWRYVMVAHIVQQGQSASPATKAAWEKTVDNWFAVCELLVKQEDVK